MNLSYQSNEAQEMGSPVSRFPEITLKKSPLNHIASWTSIPQIQGPLFPYIPKIPNKNFKRAPYIFK